MLLQLLSELMIFTKILITRLLHSLKKKECIYFKKNKKQMYYVESSIEQ